MALTRAAALLIAKYGDQLATRRGGARAWALLALAPRLAGALQTTIPRDAAAAHRLVAAERGLAALAVEPVSAADRRVIEERQLGYRASNVLAVGTRCRHGFPQAFVWDALKRPAAYDGNAASRGGGQAARQGARGGGASTTGRSRSTRLFRLSCPLLVKAADEWEAEGAVVNLNAEVSRSPPLAAALDGVNRDHANARRVLGPRLAALMAGEPAARSVARRDDRPRDGVGRRRPDADEARRHASTRSSPTAPASAAPTAPPPPTARRSATTCSRRSASAA